MNSTNLKKVKTLSLIKLTLLVMFNVTLIDFIGAAEVIKKQTTLDIKLNGINPTEQNRISGIYVVGADGKIFLPLLKEGIVAAGITSGALARKIEEAYKNGEIYTNPRFTVISSIEADAGKPVEIVPKLITIGGYVSKPGQIQLTKNMTLFTAIMAAGGPNTFGSLKRVSLTRGKERGIYDLSDDGPINHKNIKLYEGDIINLPHKRPFE